MLLLCCQLVLPNVSSCIHFQSRLVAERVFPVTWVALKETSKAKHAENMKSEKKHNDLSIVECLSFETIKSMLQETQRSLHHNIL